MSLDVTYGNITVEEAERMFNGLSSTGDHEPGSTEPWISNLVEALIRSRGAKVVLETGSFMGRTSRWIVDAMLDLDGILLVIEMDRKRAEATARAVEWAKDRVRITVGDVLQQIPLLLDRSIDVAFIDDNHEKKHVQRELELLYPKMNSGGLILLHDVHGVCDLQTVVKQWGGIALDFPRLGPAGGLGIIQVP